MENVINLMQEFKKEEKFDSLLYKSYMNLCGGLRVKEFLDGAP